MASKEPARKVGKGDVVAGRYRIEAKLGEGGCGSVWRATDLKRIEDGRQVAIKVLENRDDMDRFRRESKVMRSVTSRHVVKAVAGGTHAGQWPYLILEYMDGGSIRDLLDRRQKLPPREAAWILLQAVRGLKRAGAVHRDLKPENLLLAKGAKGNGYTLMPNDLEAGAVVKVTDFGLAKSQGRQSLSLTQSGQVMGTPVYMSPEQCRSTKKVSVKTDIYALGVILYELTVGKPPFDGSNVYDIMNQHCNDDPKVGRVPAEVREICRRCLEKQPGRRYPNLTALEAALELALDLRSRGSHRRGLIYLIVVVAAVAALAAGAWFWRGKISGWYDRLTADEMPDFRRPGGRP